MEKKMCKLAEALKSPDERIITEDNWTIEQILEVEEYHRQGKEHPLEKNCVSWMELRQQLNKYGLQAEEYLIYHNYKKYLRLKTQGKLETELLALQERITDFRNERAISYRQPQGATFTQKVTDRQIYQSETESLIFSEYIVPFAEE